MSCQSETYFSFYVQNMYFVGPILSNSFNNDRTMSSEVKFNIFKRINTGGLPLSAQEIRHALNQGKATEILARLANSMEFKKAVDNSIPDDRMVDRECVLRFFAFTITPYTKYKTKEFDSFLNDRMVDMNKMSDQELEELENRFKRAMVAAFSIFGADSFRKRYRARATRYPINKALFESWSVNLSQLCPVPAIMVLPHLSCSVRQHPKHQIAARVDVITQTFHDRT
jgi:uncharacterized protein with ParB-like and HNH nuclease domain